MFPGSSPPYKETLQRERRPSHQLLLPPLPRAALPPPDASYQVRYPMGSSIIHRFRRVVGDSVLQKEISTDTVTSSFLTSVSPLQLSPPRSWKHHGAQPTAPYQQGKLPAVADPRPSRHDKLRAEVLAREIEVLMHQIRAREMQQRVHSESAKMQRSTRAVIDRWKSLPTPAEGTVEEDNTGAALQQQQPSSISDAATERIVALADNMTSEKRWRVPKGVVAEVFKEPRMSCFPVTELRGELIVKELESVVVHNVLWIRVAEGWIGSQFSHAGMVQEQLIPQPEQFEGSVRDYMMVAGHHIVDGIEKQLERCPVEKMLNSSEARELYTNAQRRRTEIRLLPSGHHELLQQIWIDMQQSSSTQLQSALSQSESELDEDET